MSIIDDDHDLDRILESMSLVEYELIDLPTEQHDDSSHEFLWASEWLPPWIQKCMGLAQGSSLSSYMRHEKIPQKILCSTNSLQLNF